jgi:asparagine synthase (glutamine-hydrolysing)
VCGIVGILARDGAVPEELLERATQSLAHRGPDDHGTVILRETHPEPIQLGLGNRRLAILDLSPLGHQPMQDPDTGNWIVHNGEVYNFREVRAKLEDEGVRFTSHSDTEVILKAYARWGEGCLQEFRGMFAFAIWDAHRQRLLVARDPMGIKPLYYYQSDRQFLFASELRTLLGTGLIRRTLDQSALLNYLAFGSVYEPDTLISGISALPPGHYLTWEQGTVTKVKYWDLAQQVDSAPMQPDSGTVGRSRGQLQDGVHATLDQSVRMQLVSDVPVGVFLSGGIDSSSLVGILSRSGVRPSTFSIVFREADYSEAEHSRAVATLFRTDHHEITVSQQDAFEAIPAALRAMDQPTMDGINTYFVSQRTRAAGVKVALSGLGGDELFAGYSSFHAVPRMERFGQLWTHFPRVVRGAVAGTFAALAPTSDQNRKLSALIHGNGRVLHPYFLSRMLFAPKERARLVQSIGDGVLRRADAPLRENLGQTQGLDPINRVSYLESRCYMLNTLLRDADCMSMAHGLEVRVPLIDHHLAQQVMALPGTWKVGGEAPKRLLVSALNGALPNSIVRRAKRGFTLPFEHWMRGALRSEVEGAVKKIRHGPLREFLNVSGAQQVWNDFLRGETSWSRPWSLFVLQRWCEQNL